MYVIESAGFCNNLQIALDEHPHISIGDRTVAIYRYIHVILLLYNQTICVYTTHIAIHIDGSRYIGNITISVL